MGKQIIEKLPKLKIRQNKFQMIRKRVDLQTKHVLNPKKIKKG